ncbi:hypothetical protein [Williamsia sp. CHRR-6]|uniref:DUF6928 family protein n=1 Tax=Williamsia sp. CHRR-6 TaxID=2835871 RepID=UPI001BD9487E|nr:hypothetical protein [Williamsia sp. CHRR-6]MBT0566420.1 hypothetical protein [Williamsia sp. CHRR-6]
MSPTASMLWLVDSDDLIADLRLGVVNDHESADALAHKIFPENVLIPRGDTTLDRAAAAGVDEIFVGVYGRLAVVAGGGLAARLPSTVASEVVAVRPTAVAHLIHAEFDSALGAFAQWDQGKLRRSFSATPVDILEDIGLPFVFEREFWAGEHPLRYADGVPFDPQALPFHPIEFADHVSRRWLGFRLTQPWDPADITPDRFPLRGWAIRPQGYEPTAADTAPPSTTATAATADIAPQADTASPPEAPQAAPTKGLGRWFGFGKR